MAIRTAILSDIHGNLEALDAVLADAAKCGADRFVCLGDIIGFGADVVACVDRVREVCAWSLMGNHEYRLREHIAGRWTLNENQAGWVKREVELLVPGKSPNLADKRRWDWLRRLETQVWEGKITYVHGRPTDPILGWITQPEASVPRLLSAEFDLVEQTCFHGHTHIPGLIEPDGKWREVRASDVRFDLATGRKTLVNVGAVGQPRDENPQACYVLHEAHEVRFRRVDYDIAGAAAKIRATKVIPDVQAERLKYGR